MILGGYDFRDDSVGCFGYIQVVFSSFSEEEARQLRGVPPASACAARRASLVRSRRPTFFQFLEPFLSYYCTF